MHREGARLDDTLGVVQTGTVPGVKGFCIAKSGGTNRLRIKIYTEVLQVDILQKIIGIDKERRNWLCRYHGRLEESVRIGLADRQTRLMRRWSDQRHPAFGLPPHERAYVALVSVLHHHERAAKGARRKSRDVTSDDMDQVEQEQVAVAVAVARAKQKKTRRPKKRQLLDRRWWPLVVRLRGEGLPWGEVAGYLRKHHRYSLSGDYLRRSIVILANDRARREEPGLAQDLEKLRLPMPAGEGGDG